MSEYLTWNKQTLSDFSSEHIAALYRQGYLFTRLGKGIMHQTRSLRIDLSKFELSSENRRILRKTEGVEISVFRLPITDYHWHIAKMAKDFYDTKFGRGIFSANKIKELLTDAEKSNFTLAIAFQSKKKDIGYAICYDNGELMHYSYPFYDLAATENLPSLGLGMMLKAIIYAKESGKQYMYLGSAQRPTDTYKLQFAGIQWFDGEGWSDDGNKLRREIMQSSNVTS